MDVDQEIEITHTLRALIQYYGVTSEVFQDVIRHCFTAEDIEDLERVVRELDNAFWACTDKG